MARMPRIAVLLAAIALVQGANPQATYDLVLKGGHVIDGRNQINAIRDVAIKGNLIAAVAPDIPASSATRVVDVSGLYVAPGLVDIHVHVFPGDRPGTYAGGDLGLAPDGFTLRSCVTTVADAGSSGWRSFPDFKARIIDRSKTRVVAFLNIVGVGMREGQLEQNLQDMDVQATAAMAMQHKGVIVGIKSAHFNGPEWTPYEKAEEVGRLANIPVMVDFGGNVGAGRTLYDLLNKYFRPGDIFTHMYGGVRGEQDENTHGPSQAMIDGRKRGVMFDVGHGGGSFKWSTAVPLMKAGFIPDSISTDLHATSMNAGMKNMLEVMSKFLLMGMSLEDVVLRSTWNPAKEIQLEQLGHLSVGAPADIAVFRVDLGRFGFVDQDSLAVEGTQRLACEATMRDGKVLYDANGITMARYK
jgi:dihydroorotase